MDGHCDGHIRDSNLACREELEEKPAVVAPTAGVSGRPITSKAEPPKSAAGFDFGSDPAKVRKDCEVAGYTWTAPSEKTGVCSGPATDVGFAASVRVDFCDGKSCRVTLVHRPESRWAAIFTDLRESLTKKYGEPRLLSGSVPEECRETAKFMECLEDGSLRMQFAWSWSTREHIDLSLGKPAKGTGPVAISIRYDHPTDTVHSNVDAL